jgi:hypothetical protein
MVELLSGRRRRLFLGILKDLQLSLRLLHRQHSVIITICRFGYCSAFHPQERRRSRWPKYMSMVLWRRSTSQQITMEYWTCCPPSRRGYDYVIAHDQGTIEIVVWGKRGEAPAPVQKPVTAAGPRAITAPGPRVSDVSVDPRTYPTCMALFREAADCAEMMKRLNAPTR